MQISAHPVFSSSAQKDDSHWEPSLDCMVGVVTPQSPVVPQSPESDVQCAVECYHAIESLVLANFVHQTCIAGLVKHLSPYTGRISEWISFALSPFAHKKRITAHCSLWDDFNSNIAIFNVYKWRHSDVIVIKLTAGTQNKFPTKCIFRIFYIWKTNRMTLFCNLFMEQPL